MLTRMMLSGQTYARQLTAHATQKIVIHAAIGTAAARSQYWTVMPAAVISRGSVTSHCNQ